MSKLNSFLTKAMNGEYNNDLNAAISDPEKLIGVTTKVISSISSELEKNPNVIAETICKMVDESYDVVDADSCDSYESKTNENLDIMTDDSMLKQNVDENTIKNKHTPEEKTDAVEDRARAALNSNPPYLVNLAPIVETTPITSPPITTNIPVTTTPNNHAENVTRPIMEVPCVSEYKMQFYARNENNEETPIKMTIQKTGPNNTKKNVSNINPAFKSLECCRCNIKFDKENIHPHLDSCIYFKNVDNDHQYCINCIPICHTHITCNNNFANEEFKHIPHFAFKRICKIIRDFPNSNITVHGNTVMNFSSDKSHLEFTKLLKPYFEDAFVTYSYHKIHENNQRIIFITPHGTFIFDYVQSFLSNTCFRTGTDLSLEQIRKNYRGKLDIYYLPLDK